MRTRLWLSVVLGAIGVGLLVAAGFASPASSSTPNSAGSNAKKGGTLRVNLSTTDVEYTDPSLEYESTGWQIEYATACKLFNFKEAGSTPLPEAAVGLPRVSKNGKTYTFAVRKGFRFSNGSAVTAANFKFAINRVLNKRMQSPAAAFIDNIVGADAVQAGTRDTATGVTSSGSRLVIKLKKARPDIVSILSMPFFQAIPLSIGIDPQGVKTYPSCGPYYIASRDVGRTVVLKRNKYYKGKRPHNFDQFNIEVNTDLNQSLLQVKSNQRDYDMFGVPPQSHADLRSNFRTQYHISPEIVTDYYSLNTSYGSDGAGKSLFNGYTRAGVNTRKAVNYAIDRARTLAQRGAFAGRTTDQMLPPNMPGSIDGKIYPLAAPSLSKARSLKSRRTGKAVLYASTSPVSTLIVQVTKRDMARIGIDVDIHQFPFSVRVKKEGHRGEPFDMDLQAWGSDYPDPVDFLDILLNGNNIQAENNNNGSYFNNKTYNAKFERASILPIGKKRFSAYGKLDIDIMKNQAPTAPWGIRNNREFLSKRTGCFVFQPVYGSMSFSAACLK